MSITYRGETFEGLNKPKATPKHRKYSHAVLAHHKGVTKLVRFGQQGVKGSPKRKGESEGDRKRREAWYARHKENIARGPLYPAWWSAREKW